MNLSKYIDHTILKPEVTDSEISQLCEEAMRYNFAAVCVPPHYVLLAVQLCKNSDVKIATVIGFPMGYSSQNAKKVEIIEAINNGVDELDVVINISDVKNNRWEKISKELSHIIQPIRLHNKIIKLIIESGILSEDEIIKCCELAAKHQIDYVKTSTGYASTGATIHAVTIIKNNIPDNIKIKASGGIRDYKTAQEYVALGVSRIGTSSGINIIRQNS